jgi:hypothetical protein
VGKYGAEFAIDIELSPAAGAFHFEGVCRIFRHTVFYAHFLTLAQAPDVAIWVLGLFQVLKPDPGEKDHIGPLRGLVSAGLPFASLLPGRPVDFPRRIYLEWILIESPFRYAGKFE